MTHYNWNANAERAINRGVLDYVNEEGLLIHDIPAPLGLVRNEADLALLSEFTPGAAAFGADGRHFWMKATDGSWNDWLDDQAST